MGRPKKGKFDDLDQDFKDRVNGANQEQIREIICKVALDQGALIELKEEDQDLAEKKEAYSTAGAFYREGTKMNKLRTKYARTMLGEKGGDTGSAGADEPA